MLLKMAIRKDCCVIRFNKITMQFNNSIKQHSNSQELFEACVCWSFKFNIGQAFLSFVQSKKRVGDRQTAQQAGMNMQQWRCDLIQQAAIQSVDASTQVKCMQWYNHTQTCMLRCLARQQIDG